MALEHKFYIGKKGTLYHQRENGSLSRFGIRIEGDSIQLFDQLSRRWLSLPHAVPDRAGGTVTVTVKRAL